MNNNEVKANESNVEIVNDRQTETAGEAKNAEQVKTIKTEGEKVYKAIEKGVVGGYKAIENGVVGGYKAMEKGIVSGFNKVNDKIIGALFSKEGETIEETKARLAPKNTPKIDAAGEEKAEEGKDEE